jgi:IS605 OrfB family transposase
VQLRYAYRLDPTAGQRRALARSFGCARVVFNDAVAARRAAHKAGQPYPSDGELSRALTAAKRTPERAWLGEVSAVVLQQALAEANRDWLHKLSTTIIRENQAVYVEDLAVSGLARTRLARSVHDAGWSMFVGMLEYKAARHGRTFGKVDRWFPSTRLCSACGAVGEQRPLHVREWACVCGAVHDRDVNAALNILAAGRRGEAKTPVELVSDGPRSRNRL